MPGDRPLSDASITLAYATPIVQRQLDDMPNARLRDIVLERAGQSASLGKSNVGGWHSEVDFFDWPHPEAGQLLQAVAGTTKTMMVAATGREDVKGELDAWGWANVLYGGGYNTPHVHPDSMWSGVYYVDAGDEGAGDDAGLIEFMDPRNGVDVVKIPGMPFTGRVKVRPRAGTLLMFPSWLYHFVNPYHGERPRISIAFNLRIVNSTVPDGVFGGAIQYPLRGGPVA